MLGMLTLKIDLPRSSIRQVNIALSTFQIYLVQAYLNFIFIFIDAQIYPIDKELGNWGGKTEDYLICITFEIFLLYLTNEQIL